MKTTMSLLAALAFTLCFNRAAAQCQGDCNNGYGTLVAGKTTTTGFFKNGKLDGLGDVYGENLYSGQWKEGKKDGFGVYKDESNISYGMFVNDLKQGLHVTPLGDGSIIAKTFDKGVLKEKNVVPKTAVANCPYGNCQNGIGVKLESLPEGKMMVYTGKFVNGALEGPGYALYSSSPNRIFATYKAGITHGFMIIMYGNGGVEMAEMQQGKRHGRVINIFPDGKSKVNYYENDVAVK